MVALTVRAREAETETRDNSEHDSQVSDLTDGTREDRKRKITEEPEFNEDGTSQPGLGFF